jgi:hypothetical protein
MIGFCDEDMTFSFHNKRKFLDLLIAINCRRDIVYHVEINSSGTVYVTLVFPVQLQT